MSHEDLVDELFALAVELGPQQRQVLLSDYSSQHQSPSLEVVVDEVRNLLEDYQSAEANQFLQQPLMRLEPEEPLPALSAGQQLGVYKILGLIDEGGMGEVYLALDTELERQVAIKVIKSHLKTKAVLRRFFNERQVLANLHHPNIAQLLEAGTTSDGLPFFVMEYVEGQAIDKYVAERRLSIPERLELFCSVCSAVSYAHQNLIIHRDIKPSNILVSGNGQPKLLDFGIAKVLEASGSLTPDLTATVAQVMTPKYASPEQINGGAVTTATDVYGLGVLLYELLTGRHPYKPRNQSAAEMAKAVCLQEPERPSNSIADFALRNAESKTNPNSEIRNPKSLRGDLDNILLKALQKEPQRRYSSVHEFSEDIRRHLEGRPVIARKDTLKYRTTKFIRRHQLGVAVAAIGVLLMGAGVIAIAWQAHVARMERARAERRFNDVRKLTNSFMFEFHDAIKDLPGSLTARQLIVRKALDYLDSLTQEAGNDKELMSELAVAYDKIGSLTFDVAKSLEIHEKALSLNEALVKAEPENTKYRQQLAESYSYVADLFKERGNTAEAVDNYQRARLLLDQLGVSAPANIKYQSLLAENYDGLVITLNELGQTTEALEYARKGLTIRRQLLAIEPENIERRFALVNSHLLVARALLDSGDISASLENARQSVALSQDLLNSDQKNTRYQRHMWLSYSRLADALMQTGDATGALDNYRKALGFIEKLAAADPGDKGHAHGLSVANLRVGRALAELRDIKGALESYRKALDISENLLAADPSKAETRIDLAEGYISLGTALGRVGDTGRALTFLQKGSEFFAGEVKSDPKGVTPRKGLAHAYAGIGELHEKIASEPRRSTHEQTEQWQEARWWFQKSHDLWQEMHDHGTMNVADFSSSDEVAREIARLDHLLGPHSSSQ